MTPQPSEVVGPWMLAELIDATTIGANGESVLPAESVGALMVHQITDDAGIAAVQPAASHSLDANEGMGIRSYDRAIALFEKLVHERRRSELAPELARARANRALVVRELGEDRAEAALASQTIALYERIVERWD